MIENDMVEQFDAEGVSGGFELFGDFEVPFAGLGI